MIQVSKRRRRHGSRAGFVAALAAVGLLLVGCDLVNSQPLPLASRSPAATEAARSAAASPTPASAAPSSAPTSPPSTPAGSTAIAACTTSDLTATAGPLGGAAGSRGADITVASMPSASCQLPSSPVVALVDPSGNVLLSSRLPVTANGPLLSAATSYTFSFQLSNWCDQSAAMPLHLVLALASGSLQVTGVTMSAADLPPCNGPGQPALLSTTEWAPQ
jgi:uncharacterized protein DUF4232